MELDQEKIEKGIIQEVADRLTVDESDLRNRVNEYVNRAIGKLFEEVGENAIRTRVEQAVQEGFEHSYQPIDEFGKPIGTDTTVKEELRKLIGDYWKGRVDKNGKPTDSSWNSHTRAEWMMTQIAGDEFLKQIKQDVVNRSAEFKDAFRSELRAGLDRMLGEVFHVRTEVDKAEGRNK